ncbi:acetyl-CoA C-acyltransferase [Polluticaenibacter yanchengensis]|uniref:Acetyl-CoA C-acyltransferase n=1 Tax=Polluticaenibacter yanchengensis TaxID=3014562 RepID=A0ABT4UGI0_9BACT|nr:acetyl-CoA C-acyltransferase [Chitinophagaceae bacterium LY-5]
MKNAFLVDGLRTAIGSFGGSLSSVRADDLAAFVIKSLIGKFPSINPADFDDVILGCSNQAGDDNRNVARMAALLAGLPVNVPGETVNRLCASGLSAINNAARAIRSNEGDLFIAGGVEHMTRAPYVLSKSAKPFGTDQKMADSSFGWRFVNPKMEALFGIDPMGMTAENLIERYNISRESQDRFALNSQNKARMAQTKGYFAEEIVPVEVVKSKKESFFFSNDEFMKPDTTMEVLSQLRPAFKKDGSVTAGNASGLNDGAAAAIIASDDALNKYDIQPIAKIISSAVVGVEPRIMGIGPVEAVNLALKRAGLTLEDIDVIEINEAFAAQVLSCTRLLGLDDFDDRINMNGGAIALGHPLGMSGARIALSAAKTLKRTNKKYALISMCVGVGQGYAMIIENV